MRHNKIHISIIEASVLVQALLFILMGLFGEMTLMQWSAKSVIVFLSWLAIFFAIVFTKSNNFFKALKISVLYLLVWSVIETGTAYIFYYLFNMGINTLGYIFYGVQNILCLSSVLLIIFRFRIKANRSLPMLIGIILVFIIFVIAELAVVKLIPLPSSSDMFFGLAQDSLLQGKVASIVANVFYGIEGLFISLYFK